MNCSCTIANRIVLIAVSITLFITGCSPTQPTSDYGSSEGATARASPDGFSILRHLCVEEGFASTSVRSLPANGERKLATLVWAPHSFYSHKSETMDWVDRWLEAGGKTLVYVGADYSPLADYWESTSKLYESENEIHDASVNAAFEKAKLLEGLVGGYRIIAFPWGLYEKRLGGQHLATEPQGDWSRELDQRETRIKLRSYFRVWSDVSDTEIDQLLQAQQTSTNTTNASSSSSNPPSNPPSSQPNAPPGFLLSWLKPESWGEEYVLQEKARREVIKANEQSENAEASSDEDFWAIFDDPATDTIMETTSDPSSSSGEEEVATHEVVLRGPDESPLISIVSKPRWNGSRIVLIANASLVSNLSLTYDGNRMIAKRLIGTFSPGRVGFLSQQQDPIVSDGESGATGLASLLTAPVNLLAAHLVFLGLIALFYLWPIFGRPAELPTPSTQSFSLHINALGSLLHKTGDEFYARTTIADYFKQVKKDHNSVWANLDAQYAQPAASPFREDDVNSATTKSND
ncbi:MAG: hypothetical protein MUC43_02040 [Pirellula sp.]|nr:hypothetical protein [Pirellula sp.]